MLVLAWVQIRPIAFCETLSVNRSHCLSSIQCKKISLTFYARHNEVTDVLDPEMMSYPKQTFVQIALALVYTGIALYSFTS